MSKKNKFAAYPRLNPLGIGKDISAADLSFLVVSTICGVTLSGKKACGGVANPNAINTLQRLLFA